MIRKLFNWIFKSELDKLQKAIDTAENRSFRAEKLGAELEWQKKAFQSILDGIDVSVDVHEYDHRYSPSWAVISLQGQKTDYIKFVELGQSEINEIAKFLRNFERNSNIKVDASPMASQFLRVPRSKRF